jgi:ADP-ribose pyrophosphatase YjhB (NUDIX family)
VKRLILGSGLLRRGDNLLLVCCNYEGEPQPLWTLPGGRQETGELVRFTVVREFREETSLEIDVGELAYVSESIDTEIDVHVVNCTFWATERASVDPVPADPKVVAARFVPCREALELLRADVLRIPVEAALDGSPHPRYFHFESATIAVPFFTHRRNRVRSDG